MTCHWCGHTGDDVRLFAPTVTDSAGNAYVSDPLPECIDWYACAKRTDALKEKAK